MLLMLLEEYGVEPWEMSPNEAVSRLKQTVLDWRISQAETVIRDMPSLAIKYFESQGFKVISDPAGDKRGQCPEDYFFDRPEKLNDS